MKARVMQNKNEEFCYALYREFVEEFGVREFDDDQLTPRMWEVITDMSPEEACAIRRSEMQEITNINSRPYFMENLMKPLLGMGLVKRTYPEQPQHPKQRYYLTVLGGLVCSRFYSRFKEEVGQIKQFAA